jgi:hypothetical protein
LPVSKKPAAASRSRDPIQWPTTRLDDFMRSRGIRPVDLECASKIAAPHLRRIRLGKADPSRRTIAAITRGCRKLLDDPRITPLDLFDFE